MSSEEPGLRRLRGLLVAPQHHGLGLVRRPLRHRHEVARHLQRALASLPLLQQRLQLGELLRSRAWLGLGLGLG